MFRVGKGADRFDEGNVGVLEPFGQIPSGFVIVRGIEIKRSPVGTAEVNNL